MLLKFDYDKNKNKGIVSGDLFHELREYFSVQNDAARFARRRGFFCPARTYSITPTGRFDLGMYYEIVKYIVTEQYNPEIQCTDEFKEVLARASNINTDDLTQLKLKLRDYQQETVEQCLEKGWGVVKLATGGGKTLIMASVIENIFRQNADMKCIVIVPDLGLVEQTCASFEEYEVNFTFSKWTGSSELDLSTNVVICNLGILQSKNSNTEWMEDIDVLVIDEVHKLRRSNKINKIIDKVYTMNRFGFTGTMPEERLDQWNIIGKMGPVIFEKSSYDLRKKKFISNVMVQILDVQYKSKPPAPETNSPTERYRKELEFISKNKFRNNLLKKLSKKFDNNCLIMVDYIEHGEILYDKLTKECKNKQVYYIRGEVDIEEREKVRQLMEERSDIVIIAISKIFSTGIDIKNLHYIIFASGGKAKIKIIQSIGRGLRLHKDKERLIIFDIADNLQYGLQHVAKRIQFYENESITYATQTIKEN